MPIAFNRARLRKIFLATCGVPALLAVSAVAGPGAATAGSSSHRGDSHPGSVITVTTAKVGAPGNPSVGVVPFEDAVYQSCADAPQSSRGCVTVGSVGYPYQIGQLEVTVQQWVAFLNTADVDGRDPHDLYDPTESSSAWPKYGQINFSASAGRGSHYSVAYPQWAAKPYGFATFLRAARFVNSLYNGRLISQQSSSAGSFSYDTYTIELSAQTERGMYDLAVPAATRSHDTGFVVPSQDEWIKAAYYDPNHGGTYSYWKYPTNPGVFGDGDATAPHPTVLNPGTGDVTNAATQPLASYHASGQPAPSWCPSQATSDSCATVNPFGLDPTTYTTVYQGSLSTVGQAQTTSPWGTLDQGGNAVEWTDTITAPPAGQTSERVWRRAHGGVSNAPAFQLWLSAVGLQPQDNVFYSHTYPWLGIRLGVIGDLKPKY
jgi:formylglycine-generating enzyme required for sulfatase activity